MNKPVQILGWLWLALGGLGSVYKSWHAIEMGSFIKFKTGPGGVAWEIGELVFALGVAASGYALLRGWRWSRLAIEVLASILLGITGTCLLFSDFALSVRMTIYLPPVILALSSLVIVLFFKHEARQA